MFLTNLWGDTKGGSKNSCRRELVEGGGQCQRCWHQSLLQRPDFEGVSGRRVQYTKGWSEVCRREARSAEQIPYP